MRILSVIKTVRGAGWAYRQSLWLHQNGVEVITILPSRNHGYADKYIDSGMKVIEYDISLPIQNPFQFFKKKKAIIELINEWKPDIIHAHFLTNILMLRIALGKRHRTPRVFQVPGPLHLEYWLFRKIDLMTAGLKDYWVGTCKKTCRIYKQEKVPSDRLFLSYYGGYVRDWQKVTGDGRLRSQYNIDGNKKLISMVAFFYKPKYYLLQFRGIKGHEDFVDALSIVRQTHPEVVGVIVGNAWIKAEKYEHKIKKYAHDKCGDNIIFLGYRDDVYKLYREIDIAVHPSHSENLGGAGESLSLCVPTIATNVGGFPDIVRDGETGLLVPPSSPKHLALAIINMIENPGRSREMAKAGEKLLIETCDIEVTAKQMLKIYKQVLSIR